MDQIKFISECFINPKYQLQSSKQPYHLSPIDVAMLSIDPIQKGLLFSLHNINNPSSSKTIPHFLDNLKNSLSLALVHFYPLAGRFVLQKYPDEHASSISIDCSKGPGARLIHAASPNLSVSDITSPTDVPTIVRSFFDLGEKTVNFDSHTKPILSIQVTELQDGFFIGFTMNHSVVDGTSFIHFITTLSEIFNLDDHIMINNTIIPEISRVPIFGCKPWIDDKNNSDNEAIIRRGVNDMHGQNCVVFGGSAWFDMYGPEFGFGRAVAARMGYANKQDGKVTANPGRDGTGRVDLEICLKPEYMARLEANSDFMSLVTLG